MENKNWSVFNKTIKENLNTIKELFSNNDLVLENNKVKIEKNDANENQKVFEEWKKKLMGVIEVKEIQQFDTLLFENRKLLEKREKTVERLNQIVEGLKTKYKNEKQLCEKACGAIDGLIKDKEGWLDIMTELIRVQSINIKNIFKEQTSVVKKQKNKTCRRYWWKIFWKCLLFVCCVVAQLFLFVIVGLEESCYHAEGVGEYLAIMAIIAFIICEVLFVRGIVRMAKKKFYIKQRFELILNKIEMKRVSKFEIDSDLEKVLEEMKQ